MNKACIIVVPCYCEERRLDPAAFRQYLAEHDDVGFLFVDDGSTDRTGELLARLRSESPGAVEVLELERNSGKGEAVRRGLLVALESATEALGYWDADLSTPLAEIGYLRAVLDEHPGVIAVLGSRVARLGADVRRSPLRHYAGRLFATAASVVLGIPVYDTQCGAKLLRPVKKVAAALEEPFLSRWIFDVEILARLVADGEDRRRGAELFEQPLRCWHDTTGSKLGLRHALLALVELARIRRRYTRPSAPR